MTDDHVVGKTWGGEFTECLLNMQICTYKDNISVFFRPYEPKFLVNSKIPYVCVCVYTGYLVQYTIKTKYCLYL